MVLMRVSFNFCFSQLGIDLRWKSIVICKPIFGLIIILKLLSLCFGAEPPHWNYKNVPKAFSQLNALLNYSCDTLKFSLRMVLLMIAGNCSRIARPSDKPLIWATLWYKPTLCPGSVRTIIIVFCYGFCLKGLI